MVTKTDNHSNKLQERKVEGQYCYDLIWDNLITLDIVCSLVMLCTKDIRLTYSLCHNKLILSAITGPGCLPQGNWLPDSPDGC